MNEPASRVGTAATSVAPTSDAEHGKAASPARIASFDALRGLDMLLIVGGRDVVTALHAATGWPVLESILQQLGHSEWNGFTLWDLVFPLFLVLAGASLPFSLARRRERGDETSAIVRHIVTRGLLLVAIGVVYNGLIPFDLEHVRFASVLGRIGLAWMFAALIALRTTWRGRLAALVAILLVSWAALALVPVPRFGAGDLAPGHSFNDWVDQMLLPGRLYKGDRDPEGLFGTLPAVATALIGVLAGSWLRRTARSTSTSLQLVGAGALLLGLGWLWDLVLPVNKNLWTSSYVCVSGGWSLLLLGVFHQLADVLGARRLLMPFTVIGTNALTAYLLRRFVAFAAIAEVVSVDVTAHPHLAPAAGLALLWLLLAEMHRRRIFVRL